MQKIVKNSKMIQMSIKLKYILQSNVFGLEKYKEAKNSKKILKLCRAPTQNARQTENFAVRFAKAHGKVSCLPCVLCRRTAKREKKKLPAPSVLTVSPRCQRGDDER
jgi:hypothetical protein